MRSWRLASALLIVGAVTAGVGCAGSRAAVRPDDPETAAFPAGMEDALRAPHPELDLEERIAEAVSRRAGGAERPAESGPAEAAGARSHTVEAGQTIYRISVMNGLTPEALMAANGITDPTTLKVGQVLVVPGTRAATSTVSVSPGGTAGAPVASTGARKPAPPPLRDRAASPSKGQLAWPMRGVLYARFGHKGKEPHDGIDLAAPKGTPVRTAAPGIVLFAGAQTSYGKIVLVEHANGLITLYAHNDSLQVATGQTLRAGQVIATVGESGRTSGPHLHFEVRSEGLPVDPLLYLGDLPAS